MTLMTGVNYRLLKIQLCIIAISNSKCNNISQYDCFTVFFIIVVSVFHAYICIIDSIHTLNTRNISSSMLF